MKMRNVVILLAGYLLMAACAAGQSKAAPFKHDAAPPARGDRFAQLSEAAAKARDEQRDEDAIRLYREALSLKPTWKQGLWFLGTLLYDKEQYPEVRDLMRRFVLEEPLAGPGWALLGLSEFQTREYSRAFDHLQHARAIGLGNHKELAEHLFYYTSVLMTRFEQYDDAVALLMGMVKSGSSPAMLTEPVGLAALRCPLLPSEVSDGRKELVRMAGRAALAEEAQRQDEAEKIFQAMAAAYPNEQGVHLLYGMFLLNVRPDDGIKELQRELEVAPYNFIARLQLANAYLDDQKLDEALRLAKEVVTLEPNNASGFMMLGETLLAKGDLAGGINALETSRQLRPGTVRTRWDLLRAYVSADRRADAQQEKEAIEKLRAPSAP